MSFFFITIVIEISQSSTFNHLTITQPPSVSQRSKPPSPSPLFYKPCIARHSTKQHNTQHRPSLCPNPAHTRAQQSQRHVSSCALARNARKPRYCRPCLVETRRLRARGPRGERGLGFRYPLCISMRWRTGWRETDIGLVVKILVVLLMCGEGGGMAYGVQVV